MVIPAIYLADVFASTLNSIFFILPFKTKELQKSNFESLISTCNFQLLCKLPENDEPKLKQNQNKYTEVCPKIFMPNI